MCVCVCVCVCARVCCVPHSCQLWTILIIPGLTFGHWTVSGHVWWEIKTETWLGIYRSARSYLGEKKFNWKELYVILRCLTIMQLCFKSNKSEQNDSDEYKTEIVLILKKLEKNGASLSTGYFKCYRTRGVTHRFTWSLSREENLQE